MIFKNHLGPEAEESGIQKTVTGVVKRVASYHRCFRVKQKKLWLVFVGGGSLFAASICTFSVKSIKRDALTLEQATLALEINVKSNSFE